MEPLAELIGECPAMVALREAVRRSVQRQVGARPPPILILGETGVGKGLLARVIHHSSPRAAGPFVAINCAAIPETLLEAELFGFERGAFTDARQAKPGLVEAAHRGTLLLDEVGLFPDALQAKLLDVLDTGAVRRLGSIRSAPVDAWLMAATSTDLDAAVRAGRFRRDLYHRLAVLTFRLPPLRERGADVLLLAERFLAVVWTPEGSPAKRLSPEAREALRRYAWPGNIRELRNVIERVGLLSDEEVVSAAHLALPETSTRPPRGSSAPLRAKTGTAARDAGVGAEDDGARLARALRETGWNISHTAARLGMSRHTVRLGIEKYRLRREGPDRSPTGPAPPDTMPNNLPRQLTTFVGREREMAEVRRLLGTARLLTLTGAGGCGKTRLALESARTLLSEFAGGAWLVEIAALRDPALVPQAVASALAVPEEPTRARLDVLVTALRNREILVVLDNCEHLVEACADLAAALLPACPGLRILATSREPLGAPGELTWRVPPLSLPRPERLPPPDELAQHGAVRLFLDRTVAAQPAFRMTGQNALAVAQVCYRLDGIPLAIELAAVRLNVLAVEQINARLHDRFRLLTGGTRSGLPQHHTLQATMDWSHDLLSGDERLLFRRLAVFAGSFSLEAAEAACAGEDLPAPRILDLLSRLADKSLVNVDASPGDARYRLLETVRAYANEKLQASGEEPALRARHRDWCLALVERADRTFVEASGWHEETAWLDRLEVEYPNIRLALAWQEASPAGEQARLRLAGALRHLWWTRGPQMEGREWIERILAETGHEPSIARATALRVAAILARRQGATAVAEARQEEALALHRALGDVRGVAASLNNLALLALDRGDLPRAMALAEEALLVCGDGKAPHVSGFALNNLGRAVLLQGDHERATRLAEESLSIFREIGHEAGAAQALETLGDVARDRGDWQQAAARYEEALARWRQPGHRYGAAETLVKLGDLAWRDGRPDQAASLLDEGLALCREIGDRRGIAMALNSLGLLARERGNPADAEALCGESLAIRREIADRVGLAWSLEAMAGLAGDREDLARAARALGAAQALRDAIGAPLPPCARADHARDLGRLREALGEEAFAAAWSQGRALTLEEAVLDARPRPTPA